MPDTPPALHSSVDLRAQTIRRWANLSSIEPPLWRPVATMIAAADIVLRREREQLPALLEAAGRRLAPLPEPFTCDFGIHRWLAGAREEAYSDWLAWIINRLSIQQVCFLLGMADPELSARCAALRADVIREQSLVGSDGAIGRLDILVRYGDHDAISLELKVTRPEDADLTSFGTYSAWLAAQPWGSHVAKFLIALPAHESSYMGFTLVPWPAVARRLRSLVPLLIQQRGILDASLTLGFVAAIEQSLLELPGSVDDPTGGTSPWRTSPMIDHLNIWLNGDDGNVQSL